jgi:DNA-binding transcriptional ArsR family regulator
LRHTAPDSEPVSPLGRRAAAGPGGAISERLGEALDIEASYPNISQHLDVMRDADLVISRREGTTIYYGLSYPQITRAGDIVRDVLRAQLVDMAALARR